MIKVSVKQFIEDSSELLDNSKLPTLFSKASEELSSLEFTNLVEVLEEAGIPTVDARWKSFDNACIEYVNYNKSHKDPLDPSNSWSRLSYMLDGVSHFGFLWDDCFDYVLANQTKLGVRCTPLPPDYGWSTEHEYNLGWLNIAKFKELYIDNDAY